MKRRGVGGHQSPVPKSSEWATPPHVISALGGAGAFDLDPCAMITQPWPCAQQAYTRRENGLSRRWQGKVYMNPPYGREIGTWLERLAEHDDGIALIFARTETEPFQDYVWGAAKAILFPRGRFFFHRPNGVRAAHNGGAPSVLVAYGDEAAEQLSRCKLPGFFSYLTGGKIIHA